ncbi:uncharacterized protein LOC142231609 [Haematobia irritans]|uniref:uncharacterized protein LOC142231609 n=1 Tax=Haematobia irritans TaxID=7368 RepID=UPI003F4F4058
MQQIWADKVDWDTQLKPHTLKLWRHFTEDYPQITKIRIPRWVQFHPTCSAQLHGFCDASEKAYAAVVYLRITAPTGKIFCNLLLAKTKVAPLSKKSIPRLELCSAALLAKIMPPVMRNLNMSMNSIYLWTDSTIVLAWLQKPPNNWNTFVSNRVAAISEDIGTEKWNHVISKDNPADIASRGTSAELLQCHDLWWQGPIWLRQPTTSWPKSISKSELTTDEEIKLPKSFVLNTQSSIEILDRFSSFSRMLRVISYVFRFYFNSHPRIKQKFKFSSTDLIATELNFVRHRLILLSQEKYFSTEYQTLQNGEPIKGNSKLLSLNPIIDSTGLMRCKVYSFVSRIHPSCVHSWSEPASDETSENDILDTQIKKLS